MKATNRQALFQALFETAPDAMVVVDRQARIVLANPHAERLFGYASGELVNQPIEVLLPADRRTAHRVYRDDYIANPRERPMGAGRELAGVRRDGSQFPAEIALSPIALDGESLFAASIRDVSETLRARHALTRASYDAFVAQIGQLALESRDNVALIDSLPQRIVATLGVDAVGIYLSHDERGTFNLRAASNAPGTLPHTIPAALLQDTPGRLEDLSAWASASGFAAAAAAPLFDRTEAMGSLVALSTKPQPFDRDALHLLQSVANLLAAALQRSRTEEQLAHSQRLDAIGQLTGGVAHDFNNLLTIISGNLQLLDAELPQDSATQPVIASALRAVDRGANLTRKLLAFARRQRLNPHRIAPRALLDDIATMLRRTLGDSIVIATQCTDEIPDIYADPAELDAALVNLALNSRDAMPRGGRLMIDVRCQAIPTVSFATAAAAPGDYVVFSVNDTGTGMSPGTLARALEPFFTTKDMGKGNGLGLSMVYGFAKQSGGHLSIDSRLGYGTRVELWFPAIATDPLAVAAAVAPRVHGGRETVLVVEDEADVREIAIAFLRGLGYDVLSAADAEAALRELASPQTISLLFTDVALGDGMPGTELADSARRLRPGLPVLLTSGYDRDSSGQSGRQEYELLQKPYKREQLANAVRQVLDQR
ncbi:MAG: PAS domain S-box protein [Tahibacter sp.]